MRKFTKKELYGFITTGGIGLSMAGLSTFLIDYVSDSKISPIIALSSLGAIVVGGYTANYGRIKQPLAIEEENDEEDEKYENVYDLDVIDLKRKNLKIIESRFEYDKNTMNLATQNIISYNILKEKLLIKKVIESLDSDLQSVRLEADLTVSMIIETGFDAEYTDYKNYVLTEKIIEFPRYESKNKNTKKEGKVLEFPKNSNN